MSHKFENTEGKEAPEKTEKTEQKQESAASIKDRFSNMIKEWKDKKQEGGEKKEAKTESKGEGNDASKKLDNERQSFLDRVKVDPSTIDHKKALDDYNKKKSDAPNSNSEDGKRDGGRTPGEDAYDRLKDKHYLDIDEK